MKYTLHFFIIFFTNFLFGQTSSNVFPTTERNTIYSQHLEEDRSYQIYLPPSYYYSDKGTYPVIYLIDGDYNFYYQTAIIESLATVGEKIPEVIVVGISDKGNAGYRLNCTAPLSKLYFKKEQIEVAKEFSRKAIEVAKKARVKQWYLNELQSQYDMIQK